MELTVYTAPLIVAIAAFAALWPISVLRRDASIVDIAWAPGFAVQIGLAGWISGTVSHHGWLLLALIGIWSMRLTWTLGGRWLRAGREDPRYSYVRESWGPAFWWKSLFIVFLLQSVLQWLIVVGPIRVLVADETGIGGLAVVGLLIACAGLLLEALADRQLDRFRRVHPAPALMTSGLRAHIRHPNYAGEIVFWSGVGLIALDAGIWAGLISPILVSALLIRVSGLPLMEEHLEKTRPDWPTYKSRVPALVPRMGGMRSE